MPISSDIKTPEAAQTSAVSAEKASALRTLLPFALVFGAACCIFFAQLGAFPLFNPDEAYYAEPAREMLDTGEYITTLLNYVVRFTKPPLVIWAMAGAMHFFGANEFAARFFGAACGAVLVGLTFLFARRYVSERAGFIASGILLTSPLFIGVGRESIADMPLSLFIAASLMSFFHSYATKLTRYLWVAYALIGLAIMTKGPVGLVLPVGILLAFHLLRGDLKQAIRHYRPLPGLLITALIGLPWFVIEIYKTKGGYYNEFIVRENFQRFTSVVDHKAPWWYHIAAVFGGLFPWSLFLPAATFVAAATKFGARSLRAIGIYIDLPLRESAVLFCGVTAAIVLAFFSASVSKLFSYTVPAFPAFAIVIASYIDRLIEKKNGRPLAIGFAICAVLFGAGFILAPMALHRLRDCPGPLLHLAPPALAAIFAGTSIAAVAAMMNRLKASVITAAVTMVGALTIVGSQAVGILSNDWEMPVKDYAQFAAVSNWPIIIFNQRKFSVIFYAHRKTLLLDTKEQLEQALGEHPHVYIITHTRDADLVSSLGCKILSRKGKVLLAAWNAPSSAHASQ
jgi:4-amino-4-deoxy-L-arabinose transferase-like glycosyltransferase